MIAITGKASSSILIKTALLALILVTVILSCSVNPNGESPDLSAPGTAPAHTPDTPGPEDEPGPVPAPSPPAALRAALDAAPVLTGGEPPLRKFPYPFKAMLAITSDCDSTTVETFEAVHRFLNTFEDTVYGKGLGLDISDSFFVYNGSDYDTAQNLMSYCEGVRPDTLLDAALIKKYYECGWIDSIHAFGDFSNSGGSRFTRELGERAWSLLDAAGIAPSVWIDHGTYTNVQNFGAYNPNNASSYQAGDNPASPYYHTDITLSRKIRYVWYSRHSDVFGADYPMSVKTLRDGNQVWSFTRYTSEFIGTEIDWTWRPNRVHDQITADRLDSLEERGQYAIIAQHLTVFQPDEQFGAEDIAALRLLSERHHVDRSILVARTSRLLDYALAWKHLRFQVARADGFTGIRIISIDDPVSGERVPELTELAGLTFYCDDPERAVIYVGDTLIPYGDTAKNPPDGTGMASVGVTWFAPDTADYTD